MTKIKRHDSTVDAFSKSDALYNAPPAPHTSESSNNVRVSNEFSQITIFKAYVQGKTGLTAPYHSAHRCIMHSPLVQRSVKLLTKARDRIPIDITRTQYIYIYIYTCHRINCAPAIAIANINSPRFASVKVSHIGLYENII